MNRILALLCGVIVAAAISTGAAAQSCPTFTAGKVLTPAQWQACFNAKQNALGYTAVNKAGDTMAGLLRIPTSTTTSAFFNIQQGDVPSAPNDGDIWTTTAGLFARINGSTVSYGGGGITALTGDVTATGPGSVAATIAANAVTYAKFQQVAAVSLVGNATGGAANATGITLGAALAFSGSALQTAAITGDATASANSFVTTVVKIQNVAVKSGTPTDGQVLTYVTANSRWEPIAAPSGNVPTGGTTGQVLAKASNTNFDTSWSTITGTGTVTTLSVASANGFAGTVANPTTTPAITLTTSITGILSGNGTAISAASTTGTGNVVLATSPTLTTPALGTPSAVVLTNATGLPVGSITGLGTGVATFLATPSSANLAAAITNETGSGSLVFATSPALVTPDIGVATATSVNKLTITPPASSATLTIANGKTFTASKTLTLDGTDSTTMTFPSVNGTVAVLNVEDQTLTGGANVTSKSQSTGNITVDCGARPLQYITNNGAYTITAPASDGSCILYVLNGASAGATTFSGFTVGSNTGDSLTTTNTSKFFVSVSRINSVAAYSIQALQ